MALAHQQPVGPCVYKHQLHIKQRFHRKHRTKPPAIRVSDWVRARQPQRSTSGPFWSSPCQVNHQLGPVSYHRVIGNRQVPAAPVVTQGAPANRLPAHPPLGLGIPVAVPPAPAPVALSLCLDTSVEGGSCVHCNPFSGSRSIICASELQNWLWPFGYVEPQLVEIKTACVLA